MAFKSNLFGTDRLRGLYVFPNSLVYSDFNAENGVIGRLLSYKQILSLLWNSSGREREKRDQLKFGLQWGQVFFFHTTEIVHIPSPIFGGRLLR